MAWLSTSGLARGLYAVVSAKEGVVASVLQDASSNFRTLSRRELPIGLRAWPNSSSSIGQTLALALEPDLDILPRLPERV